MLLSSAIPVVRAAALLADVQRGDAEQRRRAIEALLAELTPSLYALCVNTLGVRADADDALQEALIAIYKNLDRFRGDAQVSTWAYRITIRVALRHRRKRHRYVADDALGDTIAAVADSLDAVRVKEVFAALDRLSHKHRMVLALFAIEGLAHEQIAEILGLSVGTVWSRLHHGRQALAAILEPSA